MFFSPHFANAVVIGFGTVSLKEVFITIKNSSMKHMMSVIIYNGIDGTKVYRKEWNLPDLSVEEFNPEKHQGKIFMHPDGKMPDIEGMYVWQWCTPQNSEEEAKLIATGKMPPPLILGTHGDKDWQDEIEKCKKSPYYYATNYLTLNGKQFTTRHTEEEFNKFFRLVSEFHESEPPKEKHKVVGIQFYGPQVMYGSKPTKELCQYLLSINKTIPDNKKLDIYEAIEKILNS